MIGEWIMLFFSLIVIIAIETFIYNRYRRNAKKSFKDISIANIVSTIIGVPLANAARFLVMSLLTFIMPSAIFPNKEEYVWETLSPG